MKVLVVSPRLPHARAISGHVIVHQRIRRLVARGHRVGLAAFLDPADAPYVEELRPHLADLRTVPDPSVGRAAGAWRGRGSGVPWPFRAWASGEMRRVAGDLVERGRYDVVLAEFSAMGQFVCRNPYLPAVRRVLSCHQCATVASQTRATVLGYTVAGLRERLRRERLQRYEFDLYHRMDLVLTLTAHERYQLLSYRPDLHTAVVPSGVDTAYFTPAPPGTGRDGLVYTGHYSAEPNRDAVRWFASRVWPRLRDAHPRLTFFVVGPFPTPEFHEMSRRDPRIVVTGAVEDVRPFLHRALAFVCPVRLGSGMRHKILEAMACEAPVVSTSLGTEGIPAHSGENCLLADDATIMARQLELLLADPPLARALAAKARRMVTERLSWERSVDQLEEALEGMLSTARTPGGH